MTIDSLLSLEALKVIFKKESREESRAFDQAVGSSLEQTHEGELESMLVTSTSSSVGKTNPLLQ